MSNHTLKQLEKEYGKAENVYLTAITIKELLEGKPVHCDSCILIAPKKEHLKELKLI